MAALRQRDDQSRKRNAEEMFQNKGETRQPNRFQRLDRASLKNAAQCARKDIIINKVDINK